MTGRRVVWAATLGAAALFAASAAPAAPPPGPGSAPAGLRTDVVFSDDAPLASNAELARRMLSPMAGLQIDETLRRSGRRLPDQPLDVSQQRFVLYVPPKPPPHGYGLLVFVPPWDEAEAPHAWLGALDRAGLIFVSAVRSGNDQSVIGRRVPLALIGAQNVMRRYAVDPARVYVAGFSGGAHVALHLALGYPDLFQGALLMGGSDPIGADGFTPPPAELFARFQAMRLVYLTGADDPPRLVMDVASQRSMRNWCVFDTESIQAGGMAHQAAPEAAFAQGLAALERRAPGDPGKSATCQATISRQLDGKLADVATLVGAGRRDQARARLLAIDRQYGGLAAPRSLDLWGRLDSAPAAP